MSFFRAIAAVGSLTMLSRIFGFVRDVITAAYLGAGPLADAFFVALKLPNFFRRVTAEGAFSIAFVPLFSGMDEVQGRKAALKFAGDARSMMLVILLPVMALCLAGMPGIVSVITPGFTDDPIRFDAAVELARITFPYMVLISLVALYGGVLNALDRFSAFAAAPVLFNLTLIAALVGLTPYVETAAHALAYGVLISGVVQLIWMVLNAYTIKIKMPFSKPQMTPDIKKVFRLMGPSMIGAGVVQINLFIDMILASFLEEGAISYLYYADRLYQLPLAVIGIAIGTALLPMLARSLKSGDSGKALSLTRQAILYALIFSLPAAAALLVMPELVISVLFERGAFDATASLASAQAMMGYAIGLPALVLVKVFATVFFAGEDTKTPVKFAIITTIANTLLSIALIQVLGHVGIALATGIAAWLHLGLLVRRSAKDVPGAWQGLWSKISGAVLSAGIMAAMIWGATSYLDMIGVWLLTLCVIGGAMLYFAVIFVLRVIKLSEIRQIFVREAT